MRKEKTNRLKKITSWVWKIAVKRGWGESRKERLVAVAVPVACGLGQSLGFSGQVVVSVCNSKSKTSCQRETHTHWRTYMGWAISPMGLKWTKLLYIYIRKKLTRSDWFKKYFKNFVLKKINNFLYFLLKWYQNFLKIVC